MDNDDRRIAAIYGSPPTASRRGRRGPFGQRAALEMRERTDDIPEFGRESSFVGTEPPEKSA